MTTPLLAPQPAPTTDAPRWRWAPGFVLAFVALWPASGIAEGVLVLGALVALAQLLVTRFRGGASLLSGPAWALTTVLFLAYWLPQVLSSFDAVDARHAFYKSATALRYLPFLWLTAGAVSDARGRGIVLAGLALIVMVWTLDALLQAVTGTSVLFWLLDAAKQAISGRPMCDAQAVAVADRLGGVLGPCNLKLGIVLASLSPFALYAAGRRFGSAGWLVSAALVGIVVVLAGARASWLTYALVLVFSGWQFLDWKKLVAVFVFGAMTLALLDAYSPRVHERMARTTQVLSADEAGMDSALSGRGRIWGAAACMVREHPINGVGARSFREAFPGCDPEAGKPAAWGTGPAFHAHQIVLEILSETGLVGLLLWLGGAVTAWRAWRYAPVEARNRARPAMLALTVTVFPLNTHLAFYSTFWGGLTLMLAALYAGSLLGRSAIPEAIADAPAPPQA